MTFTVHLSYSATGVTVDVITQRWTNNDKCKHTSTPKCNNNDKCKHIPTQTSGSVGVQQNAAFVGILTTLHFDTISQNRYYIQLA